MSDERLGNPETDRDLGREREMSELDARFVAFLRREAVTYHAPPKTPAEAMWPAIEAEWRLDAVGEAAGEAAGGRAAAPDAGGAASLTALEQPAKDLLRAGAAAYHRPPDAPPREEMWPHIESLWRLRTSAPPDAHSRPRLRRTPWTWAAGIAAALVLGVLIGRGTIPAPGSGPGQVATDAGGDRAPAAGVRTRDGSTVATPGETEGGRVTTEREASAGRADEPAGVGAAAERSELETGTRLAGGGGETDRATVRVAVDPRPPATRAAPARPDARSATRRAAAERHLARVETFLTSFRGGEAAVPEATGVEAVFTSRWARELLVHTRLLLDWSADEDPRLRTLLEELELVLVQIVRLDGETPEREWIVDAMDRQSVLPRLRSAIPAGRIVSTTGA